MQYNSDVVLRVGDCISKILSALCRSPNQREQERAGFHTVDGCDWWDFVIPLLRTQQSGYGGTYPTGLIAQRTSTVNSMQSEDLFGPSFLPEPFHGMISLIAS